MALKATDEKKNSNLNFSNYFSCHNEGGVGGRVWNGAVINNDPKVKNKYESIKCSGLTLDKEPLNNICNCEILDQQGTRLKCPDNKFLRSYNPQLRKFMCCQPCSADGKILLEASNRCTNSVKSKDEKNITCPKKTFLNEISIAPSGTKIKCCTPALIGELKDLNQECRTMGLESDKCTHNALQELKTYCTMYGVEPCSLKNLQASEENCNNYGMKYFDRETKTYINTDSQLDCHAGNSQKLDKMCKDYGIQNRCTWNAIYKKQNDAILKGDENTREYVENMLPKQDKKIEMIETILSTYKWINYIGFTISGILFIVILIVLVWFIRKTVQKQ